jgi:hypothetical protein
MGGGHGQSWSLEAVMGVRQRRERGGRGRGRGGTALGGGGGSMGVAALGRAADHLLRLLCSCVLCYS